MAVRIRAHRSAGVAECCVLTKQLHLSTTPTAETHFRHRSAGVAECCVTTKQLHLSTTPTAEIHFGIVGDIGTCSGYISSLWGSGRPAGGRRRLCPWWSASDRNSDRSPHKVCPSRSVRSMLAGGVGYFVSLYHPTASSFVSQISIRRSSWLSALAGWSGFGIAPGRPPRLLAFELRISDKYPRGVLADPRRPRTDPRPLLSFTQSPAVYDRAAWRA